MDKPEHTSGRESELVRHAAAAREHAYAPYSRFRVGAAVLTSSDIIYIGCNLENVSYGLTVCAERVAIWKAASDGVREIVAVAVVVEGEPAMPCGACLQVIQEFAGTESPVIIAANTKGKVVRHTLDECLPCAFKDFRPEGKRSQ